MIDKSAASRLRRIQTIPAADNDGNVSVVTNGDDFCFPFKRVYYIHGVRVGTVRGHHAHKALEQFLICISGTIEVSLDNGLGAQRSFMLDSPCTGLYVAPGEWRTMKWVEDNSVLLVIASTEYNEADYIRNYEEFLAYVANQNSL